MESYIIPATKYTPRIELNYQDHYLRLEGDSWPENAMDVYQPLLDKLEEYFATPQQSLSIELFMEYLNTSSSKMMDDIFRKLQSYFEQGHKIQLQWFYPEGDLECKDKCEFLLEEAHFPYAITELKA